eukprot:3387467-Alexandrium_andersonii.AAC.1
MSQGLGGLSFPSNVRPMSRCPRAQWARLGATDKAARLEAVDAEEISPGTLSLRMSIFRAEFE